MPLVITFRGRPVKRRRRTRDGLLLTFYSAIAGQSGEQVTVTEAEWQAHGQVRFYPPGQRPDFRKLAAEAAE
jgi:hypothetical protein